MNARLSFDGMNDGGGETLGHTTYGDKELGNAGESKVHPINDSVDWLMSQPFGRDISRAQPTPAKISSSTMAK